MTELLIGFLVASLAFNGYALWKWLTWKKAANVAVNGLLNAATQVVTLKDYILLLSEYVQKQHIRDAGVPEGDNKILN